MLQLERGDAMRFLARKLGELGTAGHTESSMLALSGFRNAGNG